MNSTSIYPNLSAERDRWILDHRPPRNAVDPWKPHAFWVEEERAESGGVARVATLFLTNRECPWHCLMCDLWRNTLRETVPIGAIPGQIDYALNQLRATTSTSSLISRSQENIGDETELIRPIQQIKLYNGGSFFDPRAIPVEDYPAIADRVRAFERVIVECHPALVGRRGLQFRDLLHAGADKRGSDTTRLEVAMGLETAHPEVLEKLNKRMTLDDFVRAADFLRNNDLALRVFVLVKPPFLDEATALHWAKRSIDFAFDSGATVVSLIPTRPGNGALDALAAAGEFSPPKLATVEAAAEYGVNLKRGRVFADLWDLEKFSDCSTCFASRRARLERMNLQQEVHPPLSCPRCSR